MRNDLTQFKGWPVLDTRPTLPTPAHGAVQPAPGQFFSLRYTRWELSGSGDKTVIRQQETRFEQGRLWSEEREGVFDRTLYRHGAMPLDDLQRILMSQAAALLGPFLPFSPWAGTLERQDD